MILNIKFYVLWAFFLQNITYDVLFVISKCFKGKLH